MTNEKDCGSARISRDLSKKNRGTLQTPEATTQLALACGPGMRAEKLAAAINLTTAAAEAGNVAREPEFVRVGDLRFMAGIKRGFAYRKMKDGTFKSITLREPGSKFGVRLVHWQSVKIWLFDLLKKQNPEI